MVLLRSDGTPVYMLAVAVDDHDMGVTHVIRGDDHLNNAARQMMIYTAMGWPLPIYAHIPLIHGPDGKKLSKRHGALGVEEYRDMRSEEHTSELQSHSDLVCRLLLEKKKKKYQKNKKKKNK